MARSKPNTHPTQPDQLAQWLREQQIYLLKDGRYMAKIPNGVDPRTKQPRFLRPKSPNLDVIIARRTEALRKQKDGEVVGGQAVRPMTTAEWARHYLSAVVKHKNSAATLHNYTWVIEKVIVGKIKGVDAIGPIPFRELRTDQIETWRDELEKAGVGGASINYALSRLRAMYNVALTRPEMGVPFNRAAAVVKVEEDPAPAYVGSPQETRRLIEEAGEDYRASIIQVATDAGLRRSEICGLQWGDVDWTNHSIMLRRHVVSSGKGEARRLRIIPGTKSSKGKVEGPLYLSDRSMAMLRDTRDRLAFLGKSWKPGATAAIYVRSSKAMTGTPYSVPADPTAAGAMVWPAVGVHTRADGSVYDPSSLGNWFVALCKGAGIVGKSLHDLRHDCATFLIAAGRPLPVVANIMRHKDSSITAKTYAHLLKSQEKDGRDTFNDLWSDTWAPAAQEEQAV